MKIRVARSSLLTLLAWPVFMVQPAHADYQSTVLGDGPKAYYRFNDDTSRPLINRNSGTLGAAANATNDLVAAGNLHPFPGAIVGDGNRAVFFDSTTRTEIPFNAALNPPNDKPFTIEAWLYPASDQTATGQSPLANRWTLSGNRQGWVFFQRKPDASYNGGEPVGWNCRMYNGIGGSGRLDVTSLVPYQVGKWQHVVVVYDPVEVTNATLTIYIDGVAANTNIWAGGTTGTDPGYVPVTSDLDPQPAISLGNYNNANSSLNPYFGGVDEFALYTNKLSPAQILSHYQNATNANRTQSYSSLILSHNPAAYLRLDDIAPGPDAAINMGDLRATGLATYIGGVRHPADSALAGSPNDGSLESHWRGGGASLADIPFTAGNNPDASVPFTFEAWLKANDDRITPGRAPVNNRYVGTGNRTGWVIFQRDPNESYITNSTGAVPGSEGVGWNFRMYTGTGSGGTQVTTGVPYTVGEWQHFVVTWQPQTDVSPAANGGIAWQGVLTAYVNGVPVVTNEAATYSANTDPTENSSAPADFAVGSYNFASTLQSEFQGNVDELAFYTGFVLPPEQILAHYQAGTNSNPATNYSTLVLTAGLTAQVTPGNERTGLPRTYLRFNEAARYPTTNSGTLGYVTDGYTVLTTNITAGPRPSAYAGFDSSNAAVPFNGLQQWVSLNNPSSLNISGQITLEAWINPDATQTNTASIISHGPPNETVFSIGDDPPQYPLVLTGALLNSNQVYLKIEGNGANYVVGSSSATTTNQASFPVPAGDLGGGNWIYLAGTYDGANWRLYRNGAPVASAAGSGALAVNYGEWGIGSTGMGWADNFAGAIDEVAIYSNALTSGQIANHYLAGKAGTTALTIVPAAGGNVTISWPAGTTLRSSSTVNGTYNPVPGSPVSPLTIPATTTTTFYKWSLP